MRETGHLRGKSLITGQLIPQGKVPLFNRILLRIMQEVLFVAKQTSKINKDHHTPPEGVVVVEGNDYPVDLAPGGRLQYYYLIWDQKEYHPRVALILKHGYKIILVHPIKLSHFPTIHSGYADP